MERSFALAQACKHVCGSVGNLANPKACFSDLGVIEGGAQPENTGSFAEMRALGMRLVGERAEFAPARAVGESCAFTMSCRARDNRRRDPACGNCGEAER